MTFDAGTEVPPLDYNFDTIALMYPGKYPALEGVKGTIPEPSDEAVQALQKSLARVTKDVLPEGIDTSDRVALARAMREMPDGTLAKVDAQVIDAIAELTEGSPTRDEIAALPFRVRRRFISWLQQELMDPEGSTAATTA